MGKTKNLIFCSLNRISTKAIENNYLTQQHIVTYLSSGHILLITLSAQVDRNHVSLGTLLTCSFLQLNGDFSKYVAVIIGNRL